MATRIIFGLIVVVFALFFGYSKIGDGAQNSRSTLATVNGRAVGAGEFEFTLENNEARYRQMLGGNIPDNFRQSMRTTTLEQLITQKLMADSAESMGLAVSDQSLASTIRRLFTPKDGEFDPIDYTNRRKSLLGSYHFDIEQYIREQLAAEQLDSVLSSTVALTPAAAREQFQRDRTQWTFEIVRLDPKKLVDTKKIATPTEVADVATSLQAVFGQSAAREKILKTYGVDVEKVGPISLAMRDTALGLEVPATVWDSLLTLTPKNPNCPSAITAGDTRIVCRLLARDVPTDATWNTERDQYQRTLITQQARQRSQQWLVQTSKRATVTRQLTTDAAE